jgi:hypothetical protein
LYKKKEESFEELIASSTHEDALVPWLQYVGWLQQTYYSSNLQTKLLPVLERCLEKLQLDPAYKQDLRLLKLSVLYADNVKDPEDLFAFMQLNEIGTSHSLFYRAYSMLLCSRRKFAQAGAALRRGVERQAQPLQELKNELRRFEVREKARIERMATDADAGEYTPDADEVRKPLTSSRAVFGDRGVSSVVSYDEQGHAPERPRGLGGVLTGTSEEALQQRQAFRAEGLGYDTSVKETTSSGNFLVLADDDEDPGIAPGFAPVKPVPATAAKEKSKVKEASEATAVGLALPTLPQPSIAVFNDNAATRAMDGSSPPRSRPSEPICGVSPNAKRAEWRKLPSQALANKENRLASSGHVQRDAKQGVVQEKTLSAEDLEIMKRKQKAKMLQQQQAKAGGLGKPGLGMSARPMVGGAAITKQLKPVSTSTSHGVATGSVLDRLNNNGGSGKSSLLVFED